MEKELSAQRFVSSKSSHTYWTAQPQVWALPSGNFSLLRLSLKTCVLGGEGGLLHKNEYNKKIEILTILSVQFTNFQYIPNVI